MKAIPAALIRAAAPQRHLASMLTLKGKHMDHPTFDQDRLSRVFFPSGLARTDRVKRENTRFVHYTSTAAAVSILENKAG